MTKQDIKEMFEEVCVAERCESEAVKMAVDVMKQTETEKIDELEDLEEKMLGYILCIVAADPTYVDRRSIESVCELINSPIDRLNAVFGGSRVHAHLEWFTLGDMERNEQIRSALASRLNSLPQ